MQQKQKRKNGESLKKFTKEEYFSIPNLMGYFRILLVPVYLILYTNAKTKEEYLAAAAVIGLSGLTDFLDGKIARRFHMVTEFGKILDPVADKITQLALVASLASRYLLMRQVLLLFLLKEGFMAAMGAIMLKKGRRMNGAQWYGKVCTAVFYLCLFLLILVPDISLMKANIIMLLCMGVMLFSLAAYMVFYWNMWRQREESHKKKGKGRRAIFAIGSVLLVLGYLLIGGILPYLRQPDVNGDFKQAFDADSFYGDGESCDRAAVVEDNGEALKERLRLILQAKERIILSTFDFRADESGLDIISALLDAAERGVDVKILVDGFNSWVQMEWNPYFYALSSHPNVEIRVYNKVNLLTPWTAMGRMHDKYVIGDDTAYLLGGRNTFNYFLGDYKGHKNYDRDVLVYNTGGKGSGSSLYQVENYFNNIWSLDCNSIFHNEARIRCISSVEKAEGELKDRIAKIRREEKQLAKEADYAERTMPVKKISLIHNPTGIYAKEPTAFYSLVMLMQGAREQVTIHTPYVICNDAMYQGFKHICEAVPKVRLMTNSAANNGNPFAVGDYLAHKKDIINTGMKIYEYEGGISYHGKSIAIDEDMAVIGSFNMDMRSAYLDTELMLAIHSEEVNKQLRENMEVYEKECLVVTDEDSYEENPAVTPQKMTEKKAFLAKLLSAVAGWARFLL